MTKYLFIDSKDRISGTSENFTIRFNKQFNNVNKIIVDNIIIPNSIYTVDATNNTLYFFDASSRSCVLTSGVYTSVNLASEIQTKMNASTTGRTYTVSFNSTTNKMTLTVSTGTFYLDFTNSTSPAILMGFNALSLTSTLSSFTSTNSVNLSIPYLTIKISDLTTNITTANSSDFNVVVPFKSNTGEINYFSSNSDFVMVNNINIDFNFNVLKIKLIRNNGNDVYLNGLDWSMLLRIE